MPRDVNGNYTLPAGNPVAPHTIIETDWANPTCDDIAAALTDSLSRTGSGGMLVPFRNADGTQANPGMTWVNEPTSGWYRAGTQNFWYAIGNQNIFRISAAGIELAPGKTAIGISSFTNVQDAMPVGMKQGEQWFESDSGLFAMNYINPDLTTSLVSLAAAGGDFIPFGMRGTANGVASLDAGTKVPVAQLPDLSASYIPITQKGAANGVATLDAGGQVPASQLGNVSTVPPGTVIDFAGLAAPAGYLACDGTSYTTAGQPALFAAIGYTWGGAGANFNVPNLNRRTTVGSGGVGTGTLGAAVGNIGGAETHTLLVAEMPSHSHVLNLYTAGSGGPQAQFINPADIFSSTSTGISAQGGNGAHNNVQPSAVMKKCIKT